MSFTNLLIIIALIAIGVIVYYSLKGKREEKIKKPEAPEEPKPPETPGI